ncbi:flagellar hook-length control protein FliK [Paenibacillus urinalis]|uniref:Flagellar hook-length control protein FliK n=1 Tax=Paenibacillus urinalis TaxID=521520 RepID=A0AAX3N4Z6_9BACL|nr:flagellar hook-length control protein FliK [Paenibacillus urinalis]WDH84466.1 flagellar hook-length control protein FliK [Paenibacillus urinalis]
MNIGQAIRGMLGDPKPQSGAKTLELKEGMVVRAEVIQVSPDQKEAVLQIKGVQVRAALDTPLVAGQNALLQVGGQNKDGMMVMKPFQGTLGSVSTTTLADLLTNLQLLDTKENRTLLSAMQQSEIPLTKDNVKLVQSLMNMKPAAAGDIEWITSASLAIQRGLPVSGSTLSGLYYAMFGPALDEMLGQLDTRLTEAAKSDGLSGKVPGSISDTAAEMEGSQELRQARTHAGSEGSRLTSTGMAQQAADVHKAAGTAGLTGTNDGADGPELMETMKTGAADSRATQGNGVDGKTTAAPGPAAAGSNTIRTAGSGVTGSTVAGMPQAELGGSDPAAQDHRVRTGSQVQVAAADRGAAGGGTSLPVGEAEEPRTATSANRSLGDSGEAPVQARGAAAGGGELVLRAAALLAQLRAAPQGPAGAEPAGSGVTAAAQGEPQQDGADAAPAPAVHTPATTRDDSWVARVLKLLGAEHEQQVVRGMLAPAQAEVSAAEQADTLKSVLMQMEASPELPAGLKETAGQLVHLLTGHQLLMNTDRTAPFAQMNWFIPLSGADGQTTANVQIQSRRGPRGEMDASHCRIWFDLNMKQLGPTLIDMQVSGKVISLHIRTDNEMAAQIFELGREQVDSALRNTGYQLSVYKSEVVENRPEQTEQVQGSSSSAVSKMASYVPESYKGVDMRV